jgi:hypothetical protein
VLYESHTRSALRLTDDARRDLEHRLIFSASLLELPEDGVELSSRILDSNFLDLYYSGRAELQKSGSNDSNPQPSDASIFVKDPRGDSLTG